MLKNGLKDLNLEAINLNLVSFFLQDGMADPSNNKNYEISNACRRGNLKLIKLLLADPRVNPTDVVCLAVDMCIDSNQSKALLLLLKDKRFLETSNMDILQGIYEKYKGSHVKAMAILKRFINKHGENK